jgi:8-oxo-dGTP pyrophosphatase MutT (NUDIX family)
VVSDHRIFRLREDRYRLDPEDAGRDFVVVESADWINVIPLTDDRQVVLVRQFRHGVRQITLEIPGGLAGPGEDPAEAGLRELREETGYAARRMRRLGWVWPNPAIQNNACHFFLAEGAHRVGDPTPDPGERIEVVTRPLAEIPALIQAGEIRHALVVAAFGLAGVLARPPEQQP